MSATIAPTLRNAIMAAEHPEDAIDAIIEWIDCELVDDEGALYVYINGRTSDVYVDPSDGWTDDPMWVNGNDAIRKKIRVEDVPYTVKRWRRMCREIVAVTAHYEA